MSPFLSLRHLFYLLRYLSEKTVPLYNHIGLSIGAFIELEKLKLASNNNHYALKRKILIAANQASYKEITKLKQKYLKSD